VPLRPTPSVLLLLLLLLPWLLCRCIRLLSAPDRFGNPRESEVLFNEALKIAREGGTPAAFRNAATFYAVQVRQEASDSRCRCRHAATAAAAAVAVERD